MSIEQRQYDSQDLLIGDPIKIRPNDFLISTHRITGYFKLPTGEFADYYIDISSACYLNDSGGHVLFSHPVTGKAVELEINGIPVRFNTREDDGTPGAVEWHHVPDNGSEI